MDIQQVLDAIYAAFPVEPVPEPRIVIERVHPNDRRVYSTVDVLTPDLPSICAEGTDPDHVEKSAFTEAQYRAVCAFLGLIFKQRIHRTSYDAAQALYWGWNRIETPELDAVRAYYNRLHAYVFPEPEDPEIATLCHEITTAFADTPYPGDDELVDCHDLEPSEWGVELRGVKWQSAHPDLLAHCYTALSFLSRSGFRYYLPAYMRAQLLRGESNADPVFHLTHGLHDRSHVMRDGISTILHWTPDVGSNTVERLATFDRGERVAIIHYLEFNAKVHNYDAPNINQALERYWRPSLESSAP